MAADCASNRLTALNGIAKPSAAPFSARWMGQVGMQTMEAETQGKTSAVLRLEQAGSVLVLILANRPVNALSADLRAELVQALVSAKMNADIQAIVIASDTAQFSAGADMSELGQSPGPFSLSALCCMIEDFPKPVVVALNGNAVGGGLELALAAHARLAEATAQMSLPEVHLGILPGAGGTQRLPRLVGAGPALQIMLDSTPLGAGQALAIGLVDVVIEQGLRQAAISHAMGLVGQVPRRTADRTDGFRDPAAYRTALAVRRSQFSHARSQAALRIVDCVEAAQLLPIDQGLAFEAAAFADLVNTPEAKGLRHAFIAERRAVSLSADLAAVALPVLKSIAIWGGGDRAGDVIVQALGAGLRVSLVDPRRDVLVATLEHIAALQETAVADGRLTAQARDADWSRLGQSLDPAGLVGADLILHVQNAGALVDDPGRGPMIGLGPLGRRASPGAVALMPARAAGLAAELCAGPEAPVALRAMGVAFGRRLGWKVLFSGPGGPIERRLRTAVSAAIADLQSAGLDRHVIAASLAAQGVGISGSAALPPAPPQAGVVLSGCLAALANEGARMISQGVARRPGDIDAVATLCSIVPRAMGGPMFWADQRGLMVLRADLRARAGTGTGTDPQLYTPDPLFDQLIRDGMDFGALNRK